MTVCFQGNDDEAVVDLGKTSSTIHTNFEKEELESMFSTTHIVATWTVFITTTHTVVTYTVFTTTHTVAT